MSLDSARQLADAVLLEGYVLYPYRASSTKNRFRWSFGILAPRSWSEAGGCEPWWMETQVLIEGSEDFELAGMLRFLQPQRRRLEVTDSAGRAREVESLEADGQLHVAFEEGLVRELPFGRGTTIFGVEGDWSEESLAGGRLLRESSPVQGEIRVAVERVEADRPLFKLRVRVENLSPWEAVTASREEVLRSATIGTHLILELRGGAFVSAMDPPEWALDAMESVRSTRAFPVLCGPTGSRERVLASPIILYDHAQIAPESPGDFFDATEIDELLTLRTATLTDDEKRQARATDPRAAELLARVEALPREMQERLHGTMRSLHQGEMIPRGDDAARRTPAPGERVLGENVSARQAPAPGERVSEVLRPGSRVRLRPGARRTDAQDLLFTGCIAVVEEVKHDVDGRDFVAVTIEGDPAAEMHRWYGRFQYYAFDEVEPVD